MTAGLRRCCASDSILRSGSPPSFSRASRSPRKAPSSMSGSTVRARTRRSASRSMWLVSVHGRFGKVSGVVDVDRFRSMATVDARIDANAIEMSTKSYEDWVKSPEFFDVAKYPDPLRFRIVSSAAPAPRRTARRNADHSRRVAGRSICRPIATSAYDCPIVSPDRSAAPSSACARGAARSATRWICISRCSRFPRRGAPRSVMRFAQCAALALLARSSRAAAGINRELARKADAVVAAASARSRSRAIVPTAVRSRRRTTRSPTRRA